MYMYAKALERGSLTSHILLLLCLWALLVREKEKVPAVSDGSIF